MSMCSILQLANDAPDPDLRGVDPVHPSAAQYSLPLAFPDDFSDKAWQALYYLDGAAFLFLYSGRLVVTDECLQLTETDGAGGLPVGGPRFVCDSLDELEEWLEEVAAEVCF